MSASNGSSADRRCRRKVSAADKLRIVLAAFPIDASIINNIQMDIKI
jgi:hypothetical protein